MTTILKFFDYDKAFDYYCDAILKMNQCTNRNNHARIIAKPVLILSIIKLIEDGKATNHFSYEEAKPIYEGIFKKYFLKAQQQNLTPLYNPYYFLKSDKFWHLIWTNAEEKTESPSKAWIERNTRYACIDKDLWILLSHPTYRERMKNFVIEEKVLKVFKDKGNKGTFKALLQLLMVI